MSIFNIEVDVVKEVVGSLTTFNGDVTVPKVDVVITLKLGEFMFQVERKGLLDLEEVELDSHTDLRELEGLYMCSVLSAIRSAEMSFDERLRTLVKADLI